MDFQKTFYPPNHLCIVIYVVEIFIMIETQNHFPLKMFDVQLSSNDDMKVSKHKFHRNSIASEQFRKALVRGRPRDL